MFGYRFIFMILLMQNHSINHSLAVASPVPSLNITIRTDNKDDFEAGTPRVLACIVVGCASSLNVTWYLGDILLRPNVYKEVNRGNFTVSSLTYVPSLTDNGKDLVCRATIGHLSQIFEDRVTISVGQRPTCVDSTNTTVRVVEGESQTLSCLVNSDPDPEQFVWSFPGGRTIYTSSKKVLGHKSWYSSALVWIAKSDDYGPVECRAFNRFGDQKLACTFTLVNAVHSTPDCDSYFESQEFNVPCGKNNKEQGTFSEVHPEDATPIEWYDTTARYDTYNVLAATLIGLAAIAAMGWFIKKCYKKITRPRPDPRALQVEMVERMDRAANLGDPLSPRFAGGEGWRAAWRDGDGGTPPCRITSRSCNDYQTPIHKHEYCV